MTDRPWAREEPERYRCLPLRAHALLAEVPLHDVWRVFLPGRNRHCTMVEVREVALALGASAPGGGVVPMLLGLRRVLGGVLGWDRPPPPRASWSRADRLTGEDRTASLVSTGTRDGPFEVLFVHEAEAVSEIRNATVQAYLVWAIVPAEGGHDLLWAIHVESVGAWTRPYMALIDPFRRWLVYPALLRRFHEGWVAAASPRGGR